MQCVNLLWKGLVINQTFPGFVPVEDYIKLSHDSNPWLIKDLIPVSGAALLYSPPKVGKTAAAIQLACALSGGSNDWLGFQVMQHGCVCFVEVDTPRSTFRLRWGALDRAGIKYNKANLMIADRESLSFYPFDILQPTHMKYLHALIQPLHPVAVIVDTLRKIHTGDEDSSTNMSNVVSNLISAVHPASLVILSHSRKPSMEGGTDLMAEHRGSGAVAGEMDGIMRLSKNRLVYGGRNIEEGEIKLDRMDANDILLWKVRDDADVDACIDKVLLDVQLNSMRAKAKALGPLIGKSEEACMSMLRRATAKTVSVSQAITL